MKVLETKHYSKLLVNEVGMETRLVEILVSYKDFSFTRNLQQTHSLP